MEINNNFIAFSGASPGISTSLSNLSYTSYDGGRIYLNFDDIDSSGLEPTSGLQLRFSVTKIWKLNCWDCYTNCNFH